MAERSASVPSADITSMRRSRLVAQAALDCAAGRASWDDTRRTSGIAAAIARTTRVRLKCFTMTIEERSEPGARALWPVGGSRLRTRGGDAYGTIVWRADCQIVWR